MMKAERIALSDVLNVNSSLHKDIQKHILDGAVFIYPTETIYGIGGNGLLKSVPQKVLSIKKRPPDNPFILIASDISCFAALQPAFTPVAQLLAEKFWPGPLTQIVWCEAQNEEIALRVTDHPFISFATLRYSIPLISTSANISGEQYNNDPDYIYELFANEVDFMIDAGELAPSPPSTVVRAQSDSCTIIREGAVGKDLIQKIVAVSD